MNVRLAYLDEPPFGWTGPDHTALGADIELADVVLRALGVHTVEHCLTTFDELLPGVRDGRWEINVPLFVTRERAAQVAFSVPVWAIGDGFLVQRGNPKSLTSYPAVAARGDARLGIIAGQVQFDAAIAAGIGERQIVIFRTQPDAVAALRAGDIDAYASTAVGNRTLAGADENAALQAVAHDSNQSGGSAPLGAFSFSKGNLPLRDAMNQQLQAYLGSADHRARMSKYGLTNREIDAVVIG